MKLRMVLSSVALLFSYGAHGADTVTQCDRLASHPEDPDKVAPGVERDKMDLKVALATCEAEVKAHPDASRSRYELARVLFYANENERAVAEMRKAADSGYRQAQFVFGLFVSNGREHAPKDPCLVEHYWLKAARAGRQAARVSYVRHMLKGRFEGCALGATNEEMTGLLATATREAKDYYEKLLIEDLTGQLAARAAAGT